MLGVGAAAAAAILSLVATVVILRSDQKPAGPMTLALAWWWAGIALSVPLAAVGGAAVEISGGASGLAVTGVAHGLGLGLAGWGVFIERWWIRSPCLALEIQGLPREFDGYRVVHLSDLHIARFTPPRRVIEWERRLRRLAPDLVIVTGDLSSRSGYRIDRVVDALARFSSAAPDGAVVSFGNHERRRADEVSRALADLTPGVRVLRGAWLELRRGDGRLFILGMDDWDRSAERIGGLAAGRPGAPCVLIAHSPALARAVLENAPELDPALLLVGHTHGGQIGVPGLGRWLNLTRLTGEWAAGLRRRQHRWELVNAGLGTSGPPLRIGIRPEMPLLILRAPAGTMA